MWLLILFLFFVIIQKNLLILVGPMTNDDKTSSNFTCVEEQRISEREGVVQVLMCKHAHVSQVNTHLLSLLCASVVNMCWCFTKRQVKYCFSD